MKVLHVIWSLGGGGKERRLIQLIRGLYAQGFEQTLVAFSAKSDYEGTFEEYADFVVIKGMSKLERCRSFSRLISEKKPDVVHLWQGLPLISLYMPLLKLKYGFKYVAGFVADAIPAKPLSFMTISNQFTYLFADAIVSNSKAGLIAKKADYKKSHVIYNGFDFRRFDSCSIDKDSLKEAISIKQRYLATMVARFTPSKDYGMFLSVAKLLQGKSDVAFLAVGKGETLSHYEEMCKKEGIDNVYFLGFRKDVEGILKCSDFGLLFTNDKVHAEGVSNSILESMAAGLPVIATNGGGTPEIIENGVSGFIVEPGDCNQAVELLKKLLSDNQLKTRLGLAAKQRIEEKFSLRSMTDKYINLYASM